MKAFASKLAVLGVVAGGFYATGDLPRLIERGRSIAERTSVPLPSRESVAGPSTQAAAGLPAAPAPAPVPVPPAVPVPPSDPVLPVSPPRDDQPQAVAAAAQPALPREPVAKEPTRIPMPPLDLEAVALPALQPGQRVLARCGNLVIALDVVDGQAGEVLEHSHAIHADRTVTIASTAAARRIVVLGCSAGSARIMPRDDRRIARGDWLHILPSGSNSASGISPGGAKQAIETIGPIEALGLE